MRKWWIGFCVIVTAASVAVIVWALNRPALGTYSSPHAAVQAECASDAVFPSPGNLARDPDAVTDNFENGTGSVYWKAPGESGGYLAILKRIDGRYAVDNCTAPYVY